MLAIGGWWWMVVRMAGAARARIERIGGAICAVGGLIFTNRSGTGQADTILTLKTFTWP